MGPKKQGNGGNKKGGVKRGTGRRLRVTAQVHTPNIPAVLDPGTEGAGVASQPPPNPEAPGPSRVERLESVTTGVVGQGLARMDEPIADPDTPKAVAVDRESRPEHKGRGWPV